jgi:hypothetical protein
MATTREIHERPLTSTSTKGSAVCEVARSGVAALLAAHMDAVTANLFGEAVV